MILPDEIPVNLTYRSLFDQLIAEMQSKLFRITLNSAQPDLLVGFYQLIGFVFTQKAVNKGSRAWNGQLGDMSLEIFNIQETFSNKVPGVQMSFHVKNLEDLVKNFRLIHAQIMMEPMQTAAGVIAIVMDPDGRAVELVET